MTIGPPKSEAGKRIVSVPALLLPDLRAHLEKYVAEGPNGLVFIGPKGAQLRRANFSRIWRKATEKARITSIHFHDLRHTGNTFAAQSGATLRELMDRMGHSTTRAALIYQHTVAKRDRVIADKLGQLVEEALNAQ